MQKVLGGITENPRFETLKALEQALSEAQYEETTSSYEIQKVREVLPPLSRGGKGSAGKNGAYARQGAYTVDDYYAMPPRSRSMPSTNTKRAMFAPYMMPDHSLNRS